MARSSTTFTKKSAPKGKGSAKRTSTKIKEAIGLDGWENLCSYIKTEGSSKLQEEMSKLKGKDYITAFSSLVEYVKPKLQRTTVAGDPESPLQMNIIFNQAIGCEPLNDA